MLLALSFVNSESCGWSELSVAEVMEEEPLLMWPAGDWLACARSFLALPQEKRSVLLDLYHPDLKSNFLDDAKVRMVRMARMVYHN